jgi:integrase
MAREENSEIEIFRPDELAKLLETAEPALIPFLTIGAFAGLRHAELQRLDWSEVRLDDGFIEVKASKAKTASRRLVPMQDNLKRWLTPMRKAGGAICDYANMSKQLLWLSQAVDEKLRRRIRRRALSGNTMHCVIRSSATAWHKHRTWPKWRWRRAIRLVWCSRIIGNWCDRQTRQSGLASRRAAISLVSTRLRLTNVACVVR